MITWFVVKAPDLINQKKIVYKRHYDGCGLVVRIEYKEKIDVIDNNPEDSLTYSPFDIFKFNQEKSGNLGEDDYVTILHPLVVSMVNQVTRDSPALLSIVNKAIGFIFPNLETMYLTAKVKDILFDGMEIDCRASEFQAKAVCTQLKIQIPGLKMSGQKNVFLFSILGPRNATIGKRFKVGRGISNSKDLGRVLEVEDQKELTLWGEKQCNIFKGTDGWIFPPFLTPEEGIWSFSIDLCSIQAKFVRDTEFKGVNVRRYEATLGDMEHNQEEKCYCNTPKTCLKKGVFDLTKCMGVPIYVTLPHFLETDEMYLQQVKGMEPVLEDHIIRVHFEPMTGTPIEAKKRIQFNLPVTPNNKITLMKNISQALHPIFWIEEGIELEGKYLKKITNVFLIIELVKFLRWFGIATGIMMLLYGLHIYYKNKNKVTITPVHQREAFASGLDEERGPGGINVIQNQQANGKEIANPIMSGHEFDRY
ncbi:hypothetical protein NQ314_019518 [Rhamnusium bicolor]|uniref:Sensory neuron membrane protein 1 n=1 Tax=Rhamnusium bicolor TaxID=1586634 RepID=A0AAV8WNX1_9CUCU|nr:hypothetical protein NQ314_019518 [Rhamnusium bicolor]